jgi:hypothetical protein
MSEKIYTLLLRLYPSCFRESWGDEARQLFRDRLGDERAFFPRLRLWFDLLVDLAISAPREHRRAHQVVAVRGGAMPSFNLLDTAPLRVGSLVFGGALSLAAFGACSFLINQAGKYRPFTRPSSGLENAAALAAIDEPSPPAAQSSGAAAELDSAERLRVIEAAAANLKQYYVDHAVGLKTAEALLAHAKDGDDNASIDGQQFADLLAAQMRDASHDNNLVLLFSRDPLPPPSSGLSPESMAQYRQSMAEQNCTFQNVQILPRNVGYLKFNSFPDPAACEATARVAMASLNNADAIIFDLRDNRGGDPEMVMFISAYLFDHPEYMYTNRENTTERLWTRSPVPGSRLADKPVYILTSSHTYSAAEHFSYDLKMLKRATLVGETTGGAAHAGVFHRIDDHFGMGIPETRAVNPFAKADWAVTGVEPDVKVPAADALAAAEKLAARRLSRE